MNKVDNQKILKIIVLSILGITVSIFIIFSLLRIMGKLQSSYIENVINDNTGLNDWLELLFIEFLIFASLILSIIFLLALLPFLQIIKKKTAKRIYISIIWFPIFTTIFALIFHIINIFDFNKKLQILSKTPYCELCLECNNSYFNYYNTNYFAQTPEYYGLHRFKDTLQTNSEYYDTIFGLKDANNIIILPACYSDISDFNEGIARIVKYENETPYFNYIDTTGKIISNNFFSYGSIYNDGKAIVVFDEKFGVINNNGKFLIEPIHDCIRNFKNNFAILYTGDIKGSYDNCFYSGKSFLINLKGDTIIDSTNYLLDFVSNKYIVKSKYDSTLGWYNKKLLNFNGNIIRDKNDYDYSSYTNGKVIVHEKYDTLFIADSTGKNIDSKIFTNLDTIYKLLVFNKLIENYELIFWNDNIDNYEFYTKPKKRKLKTNFNFENIIDKKKREIYINYIEKMYFSESVPNQDIGIIYLILNEQYKIIYSLKKDKVFIVKKKK